MTKKARGVRRGWERTRALLLVAIGIAACSSDALEGHAPTSFRGHASALIGSDRALPRKVCPVLIDFGQGTGNVTKEFLEQRFFVGPTSASALYFESSYGRDSLAGTVLGPFMYPAFTTSCDTSGLAKAIMAQIQNVDCQHFAFIFPESDKCPWVGRGDIGTLAKPEVNSWYNGYASSSCVAAAQETGHNYGLRHSSALDCHGTAFADNPGDCTHDEYGDTFDAMGGACRHMNAWHKEYQGWLQGCNAIHATSSGTFDLYPIELPCDAVQSIKLDFPDDRSRYLTPVSETFYLTSYYLEYRTPVGFDSGIDRQVLVHVGSVLPSEQGAPTWLINASMVPGRPGLVAGESFTDPIGGLTVAVAALADDHATIEVTYAKGAGAPTCKDGTTFAPPGSTACAAAVAALPAAPADDGGLPLDDASPVGRLEIGSASGCHCTIAMGRSGSDRARCMGLAAALALTRSFRRRSSGDRVSTARSRRLPRADGQGAALS